MRTLLLLLAAFVLCACIVTAQVNFTPTWGQGKRNAPAAVATDECKSMDTLIYIYKLVQVCPSRARASMTAVSPAQRDPVGVSNRVHNN